MFVICVVDYKKPSWFYNKDTNKWTSIAPIMDDRGDSACTVFEGKIVVSGGVRKNIIPNRVYPGGDINHLLNQRQFNSVEAYDYHENKWSYLPNMLKPRAYHTAVSIGNKMIIIGSGFSSEVFDSVTRKFTYIKTFLKWTRTSELFFQNQVNNSNQVVGIANKIYFFRIKKKKVNVYRYDVRNDLFTFKTSIEMEKFKIFSCIKVPVI